MKNNEIDYVIRVLNSPLDVSAAQWNALLSKQTPDGSLNPFMRHEYLAALHQSGSALPAAGWTPRFVTLWHGEQLAAACALYLKTHSYGEYVFDHAWANAYAQHGLDYYPKALVAVPFTPVPGARLLASSPAARVALVKALVGWCEAEKLSSLHLLFASEADVAACSAVQLMLRHTVQFHWSNRDASGPSGTGAYTDFDDFLSSLSQEKRKKIRQERRKVAEAGITFRCAQGATISPADWDFFYRCYERTYYEHGNAPYLSRDFFQRMADTMAENWVLFTAEYNGEGTQGVPQPIATSLIAITAINTATTGLNDGQNADLKPAGAVKPRLTAYGRYWGALARVDCLHFEACYYQPLAWCIANGFDSFEGGAQGEHKMARALLPIKTTSAHWLAHPSFADAVERFLEREGAGISDYMGHLEARSPFRQPDPTGVNGAAESGPDP